MRHSEAKRRRKARVVMQRLLHSKAMFQYWRSQWPATEQTNLSYDALIRAYEACKIGGSLNDL